MNPWNIQSLYDLQYYNCPSCIYKINSKQEFVNHAYDFHPESEEYLRNIKDGSISDVDLPIDTKIEFKADLDLSSSYQSNNLDIKIEEFEDTKDDNLSFNFDKSLSNAIVVADPTEVDSYYCNLCDIFYCNHYSLNEHKRVVHEHDDANYDLGSDEDISIDQFDKDFSLEDENAKRRIYQCDQCDKSYEVKSSLKVHIKTVHEGKRDHKCKECDKSYTQKATLDAHISAIHTQIKQQCPKCEMSFTTKRHRRDHLNRVHGEEKEKCFVCYKMICKSLLEDHIKSKHEFYTKYDLGYGIVDHNLKNPEQKRYQCNQCDKSYTQRGTLNQHIETIHQFVKHQCAKCGMIFKKRQSLRNHLKFQHGEEKNKCDVCGKMVFKSQLENHIKDKHEKVYQCPTCAKILKTKERLKRHIKGVHDKIRDHICEQCGATFPEWGGLHNHRVQHIDPQFECHVCGKKFRRKAHVEEHVQTVHMGVTKYPCPQCDNRYKTGSALKRHYEKIHQGIKNYKCMLCTNTYGQKVELKLHLARLHKRPDLVDQVKNEKLIHSSQIV